MISVLTSALIHLPGWHCVTFYCAFSNINLCCRLRPTSFCDFVTLFQTRKTQLVIFYSLPSLLFIQIFNYVTLFAMSSNQITFLFRETHKLFHEPLFNILTPLLSTPSVFPQMIAFSFHKSIIDIVPTLSLATSFVVSDIMNHLPILCSFHFLSS